LWTIHSRKAFFKVRDYILKKNPYAKIKFQSIKLDVKRITRNPNIVTKDQATHGCNNTCYSDKRSKVAWIFPFVVTNSYPYCRHFCLLQLHQENDIRRSKKWQLLFKRKKKTRRRRQVLDKLGQSIYR